MKVTQKWAHNIILYIQYINVDCHLIDYVCLCTRMQVAEWGVCHRVLLSQAFSQPSHWLQDLPSPGLLPL